jgi:hypothetical protein
MKTNFISNLKQFLFLALAIIGTFVGYGQPTQNQTNTVDIGGGKSSGDILLFNIGGTQGAPRDTGTGMIVSSLDTKTNCIFSYPAEIGGRNTGGGKSTPMYTGQVNDPNDFDPYDIGGKDSTGGLGYVTVACIHAVDTGGGKGTSTDTGQVTDPNDFDPYDIGGRGSNTGTGTGEYLSYEIGGKNTPGDFGPGSIGSNPFDDSDDDTGGRGTDIRVGQFAMNSLEYTPGLGCDIETGGRDSGGGLLTNQTSDIGGRSTDTGLGPLALVDTGGRGGQGTSTGGDYDDDSDDDTGGRNSTGTTGEISEPQLWLTAALN